MTDCTWHKEQVPGGAKGAHHDKPAAPAPEKWVGKGPPPADWNKEARRTHEVEGAHDKHDGKSVGCFGCTSAEESADQQDYALSEDEIKGA